MDKATGISEPTVTLVSGLDYRKLIKVRVGPWEMAVSFQDFKWACGHVGPAYCKQCHEEMKVSK
jgi:hypothetical protein